MINQMINDGSRKKRVLEQLATLGVFVGALFYCYETLLRVAPSVMTSGVTSWYSIEDDPQKYQFINAFYYYIYAPMQLPVGVLVDRYGPKKWLMIAAFMCSIGTLLYISSHSLYLAALGRFFVGFGSSFAFVGVLKLATIWLPPNRFSLVSGLTVTLGMLGAVLADQVLVLIVQQSGWRHALFQASIVGVILVVLMALFIRDDSGEESADIKKNLASSFSQVFQGIRVLLSKRDLWIVACIGLLMWVPLAIFAETNLGPDLIRYGYLPNVDAESATRVSTYIISMFFIGWAVGAPIVNTLSDRIKSRKKPMMIGSLCCFVISIAIVGGYIPSGITSLCTAVFLFGFSCSVQVIVFPISKELSCPYTSGSAAALTNMVTMFSGWLLPLCGYFQRTSAANRVGSIPGQFAAIDFQKSLIIVPVCIFISLFLIYFLRETYAPEGYAQDDITAS